MISKDLNGKEYEITAKDLAWRPSAYGIVLRDDKILLVRESDRFHLPGGGVDLGEDPKAAVIREVREETGVTTKSPRLIDAASSFFTFGARDNPPKLQHVQSLLLYYVCEYVRVNPHDVHLDKDEKIYGLTADWVELSELADITVGTTVDWRPIISKALKP